MACLPVSTQSVVELLPDGLSVETTVPERACSKGSKIDGEFAWRWNEANAIDRKLSSSMQMQLYVAWKPKESRRVGGFIF